MTRLWPKSLFGQLMLVSALALLFAQAINLALLVRAGERQRFAEAAGPVIVRLADDPVPGFEERRMEERGRRGRFGRRFRFEQGAASAVSLEGHARCERCATWLSAGLDNAGFAHRAVEIGEVDRDSLDLPPRFERRFDRRHEGRRPPTILRVAVQREDGSWLNGWMRVRPGSPGGLGAIIAQTLILYLIVLGALFFVARRVSRPLGALTRSARSFDAAGTPEPVEPSGPQDVAELIHAYNEMRENIAAMLEEKDHMLGALGHDLRTPLAALRIRAENVPDQAERERMVETIEEMSAMVEDILSLARLGRSGEPAQPLDLDALADSAIEDFRDIGADVAFEEDGRTVVNGRSGLLKRALRNLIDNAVRHGGGARVRVRSESGEAIVEIDDDGPGIPADKLEAVFEPFVRLEESRGRATGGSGLGLALARAIVRDHGGTLTLANRDEGGLRATIRLPLAAGQG